MAFVNEKLTPTQREELVQLVRGQKHRPVKISDQKPMLIHER